MKIGILSFTSSTNNYGQLLQCYGLETYLRKLGHEAYHVRYAPEKSKLERMRIPAQRAEMLKSYLNWRSAVNAFRKLRFRQNDDKREFDSFRSNSLVLSSQRYRSIEELRATPPVADAYIAGSDQIWGSPLSDEDTSGWFLKFGSPTTKRISYAASIGRQIKEEDVPRFRECLTDFDSISVRERGAQEVCQRCGYSAKVVLDPTLLLEADDYQQLIDDAGIVVKSDKYIFAYILNILYARDIHWSQFEKYVSQNGYDVVPVYSSGYYSAYPIIRNRSAYSPTIPEWLKLIKESEGVVTTSFHGVVFSVLFRRPFIALPLSDSRGKGNDRVTTLLESIGLNARIYNQNMTVSEQMNAPIDWTSAHRKLSVLRNESRMFLQKALAN